MMNDNIKFGIIGAMDVEVDAIKADMEIKGSKETASMKFFEGKLKGKEVVSVQCGMGKVNAGICAQILIDIYGVTHIINTGVAGTLSKEVGIGDIVVSKDALQHDFDVSPIGFKKAEIPYTGLNAFPADEKMRKIITDGAKDIIKDVKIKEGMICSGDQFIASREQKEAIISEFGGVCCEMEGAAIAQVCHLNWTPFVIIRAISDKADDSEEMSYIEFEQAAAERCAAITRYMIAH